MHRPSAVRFHRTDTAHLLLLLLVCLLMFFFRLGSRALWDIDEGMHAAISKGILLSGDWITPRVNGEAFLDKPILYSWLGAISMRLLGFTELAARLPGALLATATVVVTWLLGRRMFGPRTGLLGGLILATSLVFAILARVLVQDIALAFCATASLYCFWCGETDEENRRLWFLLFHVALGLGLLSKGPLGVVLPALVIVPYLVLTRRLGLLREMRLVPGLLIVTAIAGPWYLLMEVRNPGYLAYFVLEQHVGNFSDGGPTHPAPFYYYVPVIVAGLFPWSTFLPLAAWRARTVWKDRSSLYLLLWCGTIFLFFSTASSKIVPYVLPLFPAAALLVARVWHDSGTATGTSRRALLGSLAPVPTVLLAALVYFVVKPPVRLLEKYGVEPWMIYALLSSWLLLLGVAFAATLRRHLPIAVASLAATILAASLLFSTAAAPAIEPFRSAKALAPVLESLLSPGEPIVCYRDWRDTLLFYTEHPIGILRGRSALLEHLSTPGAHCILKQQHMPLIEPLGSAIEVLARDGNDFLIGRVR